MALKTVIIFNKTAIDLIETWDTIMTEHMILSVINGLWRPAGLMVRYIVETSWSYLGVLEMAGSIKTTKMTRIPTYKKWRGKVMILYKKNLTLTYQGDNLENPGNEENKPVWIGQI